MADMLTNTVGIMLFILMFVSLSASGALFYKYLPRDTPTKAAPVWVYCSGRRIVHFEPGALGRQLESGLERPASFSAAEAWATAFSNKSFETETLNVSGKARVVYSNTLFGQSARICNAVLVRRRDGSGEDETTVKSPNSAFQLLLAQKDRKAQFFYFFVAPDSIAVFRAARDEAVKAHFAVGWSPLGPDEPARISLSAGCGGSDVTTDGGGVNP